VFFIMKKFGGTILILIMVLSLVLFIGCQKKQEEAPESGKPETGGYEPAPTKSGGYGAPPAKSGGYGAPPAESGGYGAPPAKSGGYGAPPADK
jgi:uncharacterized membrane protein